MYLPTHETFPPHLVVSSAKGLKTRATPPYRAGKSNEQDKTYGEVSLRKYTPRASVHALGTLWGGATRAGAGQTHARIREKAPNNPHTHAMPPCGKVACVRVGPPLPATQQSSSSGGILVGRIEEDV